MNVPATNPLEFVRWSETPRGGNGAGMRVLCCCPLTNPMRGPSLLGPPPPANGPSAGFFVMTKVQLKKFRDMLEAKREEIIKRAQQTLDQDMALDTDDLPDEMDLASSEYLQSFTFRLRGREKAFLDKIQKAIDKIDNGTFGVCDDCGDKISVKRLEARPETTLCIRCKEDQERVEKDFG